MRKPAFCKCENKDADQLRGKTAITLTKKTVGRPSADLSADHRPIYRPIKCQILALFSSADKK